jgi:NAD(P)-dependent dehydrogenase (short-subunit alcohol dehydrogenase family)
MKEFKGKVAVITGAASGIGRGIVERCAQEGMQVVLADVEENALTQTEEAMQTAGATVLAVLMHIPRMSATQSMGRLPPSPREACHPVHVKPATWTRGALPPTPGKACRRRRNATPGVSC